MFIIEDNFRNSSKLGALLTNIVGVIKNKSWVFINSLINGKS